MSDLATTEWFGVMATKRRRVAGSYVLKKQADARKSVEQITTLVIGPEARG